MCELHGNKDVELCWVKQTGRKGIKRRVRVTLWPSEKELGVLLWNFETLRRKHPAILWQESPPSSKVEKPRPSANEAALSQRDSVLGLLLYLGRREPVVENARSNLPRSPQAEA